MRTTVDIDDDILAAARDLARAEGKTMGQILSELARRGLTTPDLALTGFGGAGFGGAGFSEASAPYRAANDWPVFPARGGPPVTSEMIERLQDAIDREDAEAFDHATNKPI